MEIEEATGITPKGLLERPVLRSSMAGIWSAFWVLDSSRMYSESGPQPIQVSEIKAYLDLIGESSVETGVTFVKLIKVLDGMYLQDQYEKQQQKLKTGTKK